MFQKKILIFIISIIVSSILLSSCSKKISGTFKVSGKVIDAFDGQGIAGVQLVLGNNEVGTIGSLKHSGFIQKDTLTSTDANGEFNVVTEMDDVCPHLGIFIKLKNGTLLSSKYTVLTSKANSNSANNFFDHIFEIKEKNTSNFIIQFQRLSTLKLNITKNLSTPIDSVVFNNASKGTKINSDTNFYFLLEPDSLNRFNIKRNSNIIWQDSFAIGLAGDTIFRNVQL